MTDTTGLAPSAEALAIRDSVAALVTDAKHKSVDAGDTLVATRAHDLGLWSLLVDEELGGLGLGLADALPTVEALGARPTRLDWVSDVVAAPLALATSHDTMARALLTDVLAGKRRVTLSAPAGPRPLARRADLADTILSLQHGRMVCWPAADWTRVGRHGLAGDDDLWTTAQPGQAMADVGVESAARVTAVGRAAAAAFALGAGRASLDLAVAHAKARVQFGRPIGSFQAIKHLLATAFEALTMVTPLLSAAAFAVDSGQRSAPVDTALALRQAGRAADMAARASLQVHGAMGYTAEAPVGRLLAQVLMTVSFWGPAGRLSDEIADAVGGLSAFATCTAAEVHG